MKKINLKRIWTCILALIFCSIMAMAQSRADNLYNQGLKLQKTMTVASQKAAISKFRGAKKLYDSASKKAMCDNAIAVSQNIINTRPWPPVKDDTKDEQPAVKELSLSVSNSEFNLMNPTTQLSVYVTASDPDWEVTTEAPKTGESFVTAKRTGDGTVSIDVKRNNSYKTRSQNIIVTLDKLKRTITVTQKGQIANLDADPLKLEFKADGQTKDLVVYCDSDEEYADNDNCNWFIVSQPEWINVKIDNGNSKESIGQKLRKLGKGLFSKNKKYADNMLPTRIQVQCLGLNRSTSSYKSGRSDYLILGSGEKEVKVLIIQKGGK